MRAFAMALCCLLLLSLNPVSGPVNAQQPASGNSLAHDYGKVAAQIIGSAMVEGRSYERLEYLTDRVGNRLSGTPQLDEAIKWAVATLKEDGLENVHTESVMVPHWVRGAESGEIIAPAKHRLTLLTLGGSVGTPPEGITAEVVEVHSFEELDALGAKVKDKIVFYNVAMRKDIPPGPAYGEAVQFRARGASRAAAHGALAALVRSVTTVSLSTPHTGSLRYLPEFPQIPAAAITLENADLIHRLIARGNKVMVKLALGAKQLPDVESANVIAELRGREHPEEVILIGGHIDSWDVGNGASDDGAGCVIAMEAIRLMARLNLRPRRTVRLVLFTNEENGLQGGITYGATHKEEVAKHIAVIEADSGAARPLGFSFEGKDRGFEVVREIAELLNGIGAGQINKGEGGADISVLTDAGVPGLGLRPDGTHYFDMHHTDADTLDKIEPFNLALNSATMAVMAYLLADIPQPLPRD